MLTVNRIAVLTLLFAAAVARGDDVTVARQRAAVEARTPELVALFDVLVEATRRVGDGPAPARSATPAADGTVAA